jgi:hypothetical protein
MSSAPNGRVVLDSNPGPPPPEYEWIYCVTVKDWVWAVRAPWGDWYCAACSAKVKIVDTH